MNKVKRFVSNLLKDYFSETEKKELIEILSLSLQEKIDDLVEQGTPIEQAIEQSIQEFGGPEDVLEAFPRGEKLSRKQLMIKRKGQLMFSLLGYFAIVGISVFFNVIFIDFFIHPWAILVGIAVLFWPGSLYYLYRLSKK